MDAWDPTSWLADFFDDAATFPPASVPLERAVEQFRRHRASEYAGLVGNLVVADVKLPDLIDVWDDHDPDADQAAPISLLVTGGAGALTPAVRWATRAPALTLRTIQVALRAEDDLAANAQRFLTAFDACEDDLSQVEVFFELPRWYREPSSGWLRALDEIAAAEGRVTFRVSDMDPAEVALCMDTALDRELPFRCTGGLTAALSGPDPDSGNLRYGFVNLLVATRGCLEGDDTPHLLQESSAEALLDGRDADTLARTRQWLRGINTANVLEAHEDLVDVGLRPELLAD